MKEKIRKLLALASDPNAAPNEAATAARQAQALMNKHDIDLTTGRPITQQHARLSCKN